MKKHNKSGKDQKFTKREEVAGGDHSAKKKGKRANQGDRRNWQPDAATNCHNWDSIKSNDIAWYNKAADFEQVTKVPFNRIQGDPLKLQTHSIPTVDTGVETDAAVPGIFVLKYVQGPGTTHGGSESPINRAFTSLYSDIYAETTGAMQFQQMDLAFLLTSFSSISGLIAFIKRAIETSNVFDAQNYYTPEALLTAMGVDPDSVFGHQDELISRLSFCIDSFNRFKLPDVIDTYKRNYSLCRNIYLDDDYAQSALYIFKPVNYYVYVDTGDPAYLVSKDLPTGVADIRDYIACAEEALAAWRNSGDLGLICGAIQRAFKNKPYVVIDYINHRDVPRIAKDRNILWQINNSNSTMLSDINVNQNPVTNSLVWRPLLGGQIQDNMWKCMDQFILNSFDGDISPEFIMEATRLMNGVRRFDTTDFASSDFIWNPEIVVKYEIYYYVPASAGGYELKHVAFDSDIYVYDDDTATTYFKAMNVINALGFFKHAPRVRFWVTNAELNKFELKYQTGALSTWTTIDGPSLYGLNRSALTSLYASTKNALK